MEKQIHGIIDELGHVLRGINPVAAGLFAQSLGNARRIFVGGAGRSGLVMRGLAMRLAQMGRTVHVIGDATTPACESGDLVLLGSGSGRTATLLPIAQRALKAGGRVFLMTRTEESPLAELSDHTLLLPVPSDPRRPGGIESVQPLGTLFEQALMVTCDILVMQMTAAFGIDDESMQARHANLE